MASRSSAFAFKGKNQDIRQVGEQLNVATVLEGSVRKAGNRLRITAQLINVADGYHLWSERYDRELEDVFAVQDEIAENIVRALRVVLTEEEKRAIERPHTGNIEAYEFYLRGRQFFYQFREKGLQFARRMFSRAIEIDPDYARAYAGIADCSSQLYKYWDASAANLEQADAASRKALELAPDLAEAHAARGFALTLGRQPRGGQPGVRDRHPARPEAVRGLSVLRQRAVRRRASWRKPRSCSSRPRPCAPRTTRPRRWRACAMPGSDGNRGQRAAFEKAVRAAERHIELNPDDPRALLSRRHRLVPPGSGRRGPRVGRRGAGARPRRCRRALQRGLPQRRRRAEPSKRSITLERAVQNGFGHREWIEHDPDLESLRSHPRYQALLSRL